MKIRIPPLLMMIFGLVLISLIDRWLPAGRIDVGYLWLGAVALVIVGIAIKLAALFHFSKAKTTINPLQPDRASTLVDNGVFAYSRNPMYLAMLIFQIAFCVYKGNVFSVLIPVLFVIYMNKNQIAAEEQALVKVFGDSFIDYMSRVRRWI